MWFPEEGSELKEECVHEVTVFMGMQLEARRAYNVLPLDTIVAMPEGHQELSKVPQDRPYGRQPLPTKDVIVADKWDNVEAHDEVFGIILKAAC